MINDNILNQHARHTFKRSFLKGVHLALAFPLEQVWSAVVGTLKSTLESASYEIKGDTGVEMIEASKTGITLIISAKGIAAGLDIKAYKSYENFEQEIFPLIEKLLSNLQVGTCQSVVFQKTNNYRLNKSKLQDNSKAKVLPMIFSKSVISDEPVMSVAKNGYLYSAQTAYKSAETEVIAELVVTAMRVQPTSTKDLKEQLNTMNQSIYDVWYNSVTEPIRNTMDKEVR